MEDEVQLLPSMPIKIGKLAMIINWRDKCPIFNIHYSTASMTNTHFLTLFSADKIIGPFYWVSGYSIEVEKSDFMKRMRL